MKQSAAACAHRAEIPMNRPTSKSEEARHLRAATLAVSTLDDPLELAYRTALA